MTHGKKNNNGKTSGGARQSGSQATRSRRRRQRGTTPSSVARELLKPAAEVAPKPFYESLDNPELTLGARVPVDKKGNLDMPSVTFQTKTSDSFVVRGANVPFNSAEPGFGEYTWLIIPPGHGYACNSFDAHSMHYIAPTLPRRENGSTDQLQATWGPVNEFVNGVAHYPVTCMVANGPGDGAAPFISSILGNHLMYPTKLPYVSGSQSHGRAKLVSMEVRVTNVTPDLSRATDAHVIRPNVPGLLAYTHEDGSVSSQPWKTILADAGTHRVPERANYVYRWIPRAEDITVPWHGIASSGIGAAYEVGIAFRFAPTSETNTFEVDIVQNWQYWAKEVVAIGVPNQLSLSPVKYKEVARLAAVTTHTNGRTAPMAALAHLVHAKKDPGFRLALAKHHGLINSLGQAVSRIADGTSWKPLVDKLIKYAPVAAKVASALEFA